MRRNSVTLVNSVLRESYRLTSQGGSLRPLIKTPRRNCGSQGEMSEAKSSSGLLEKRLANGASGMVSIPSLLQMNEVLSIVIVS